MRVCTKTGGGLGNRVLGSLTGFFISRLNNTPLYIHWPDDNPACLASWTDLFVDNNAIINDHVPETDDDYYIVHNPSYYTNRVNVLCHRSDVLLKDNHELLSLTNNLIRQPTSQDIIIQDDGAMAAQLPRELIKEYFCNGLMIKPYIIDKAREFCKLHQVDGNTIGVHMRLTDMIHEDNRQSIINQYINKMCEFESSRFFICSDDSDAEEQLKEAFPGSIIKYDKTEYVEKFHTSAGWKRMDTTGNDKCRYNVSRSKDSVIEALIDCLVLSRTDMNHFPNVGSFNSLSRFLKLVKFN